MSDTIDKLFNSKAKKDIARKILYRLRRKRAIQGSPKTVEQIKKWFPSNKKSTVDSVATTLGRTSRSDIPVGTSGNWLKGTASSDGIYITDRGKVKKLEFTPVDFSVL